MKERMGGCQCGRVRYAAKVASEEAYLCHCRMCQRASGGVAIAFVALKKDDVVWHTEPAWYASSPIAERAFCSMCGTPLGFRYVADKDCDLTVGSFDNPAHFVPTRHFGVEAVLEAWMDTSHLPRQRSDDHEETVARWSEAGVPCL